MNQCTFGHETDDELRSLPMGNGVICVCYKHYKAEVAYRLQLTESKMFALPTWESLPTFTAGR